MMSARVMVSVMSLDSPARPVDPCTRCGACCAAFRVDFHVSELDRPGAPGVPAGLAERVTHSLMRMRGTDASQPRCIALHGEIGVSVLCAIYAGRPSPCREFAPHAALGMGEPACDRARARHGLQPLESVCEKT